jgi:HEAT repeat protein
VKQWLVVPAALAAAWAVVVSAGCYSRADWTEWNVPSTEQLIVQLKEDGDPLVRQRAAWWLGEHEDFDAVWPLTEALKDRSADVRLTAAWALGEIKDRKSIPALIDLLDDGDPLVREMGAIALGEIEHPSAVEPLVEAFDDEELREAVVWALGEIPGHEAAVARDRVFKEWGRRPWSNDQVWTGRLPGTRVVTDDLSELLSRSGSGNAAERRDAALGLGFAGRHHGYESWLNTEPVVDQLLVMLRDPVPEVRAAAVWSLDEINPSRWARHGWHGHKHDPRH